MSKLFFRYLRPTGHDWSALGVPEPDHVWEFQPGGDLSAPDPVAYRTSGTWTVAMTVQGGLPDDLDPWSLAAHDDPDDLELDADETPGWLDALFERVRGEFDEHGFSLATDPTTPDAGPTESVEGSRRRLGLCPRCGTKGPFVNMTMTCPEHGPY